MSGLPLKVLRFTLRFQSAVDDGDALRLAACFFAEVAVEAFFAGVFAVDAFTLVARAGGLACETFAGLVGEFFFRTALATREAGFVDAAACADTFPRFAAEVEVLVVFFLSSALVIPYCPIIAIQTCASERRNARCCSPKEALRNRRSWPIAKPSRRPSSIEHEGCLAAGR